MVGRRIRERRLTGHLLSRPLMRCMRRTPEPPKLIVIGLSAAYTAVGRLVSSPFMAATRQPEIDWLKGFAILCVIVNHSGALNGTWFYQYVITRAVPVFIVLFGMNAESWWAHRSDQKRSVRLRDWITGRFGRLAIPYWGAVSLWWMLVFVYGNGTPPRTTAYVIASYAGYVPWVSTYWFVTLVLECVIVYPVIRLALSRVGVVSSLIAAALITTASAASYLEILHWGAIILRQSSPNPHSYFWIFLPAYAWHIVAGAAITRIPFLRTSRVGLVAGIAYVAATYLHQHVEPGRQALAITLLADVPLTLALLWAVRSLHAWRAPTILLAASGTASWGLYLGHVLGHEAFHLAGFRPDWSGTVNRWMYAGALLVIGVGLVAVGQALRDGGVRGWIPARTPRDSSGTSIR
jgi:fucose 4-O-acetylase-like acetyltransferase